MLNRLSIGFLVLATACTGELTGGMGDDVVDPPPDQVTITVRDQGVPAPAVSVVFQAPDGTQIADLKTDGSGTAFAAMPAGGNVSVIRIIGGQQVAYTYVGVKPLDSLVFGRGTLDNPSENNVTVNVPPAAGGGPVTISTACGTGTGQPPQIALALTGCATELDFFVADQAGNSFLAHAPLAGAVDLSTQAYAPSSVTMLSVLNVPAGGTTALEKRLDTPAPFYVFSTGPLATQTTIEATTPSLPSSEQVYVVNYTNAASVQMISNRQPFSATPSSIDVVANVMRATSATTVDPATGNVSWTETGDGVLPDHVTARLTVTRPDLTFMRYIVAPYAGSLVNLPALPAMYATLNWTAGDTATAQHALGRATGGYDAIRNRVFAVASTVDAVPMNGTATYSYEAGTTAP